MGRLPSILKGLWALGLERQRVPVGQGIGGGHAGEVVGKRAMVWASAMRSKVLGSHAPRRSEGGRGRGTGCSMSVGLPEAARCAAPGCRGRKPRREELFGERQTFSLGLGCCGPVQEDPGDAAFFGGIQPPQALWGKPRPTAPSPPSTKAGGASEDCAKASPSSACLVACS